MIQNVFKAILSIELSSTLKPGSQYVAQLRGAARRGAARCLRRFVNTQQRTNRAAPCRAAPRREDRPELLLLLLLYFTVQGHIYT